MALAITAHEYAYGREKIKGLIEYYSRHAAWEVQRNELSQPFVRFPSLRNWSGDGVVGEIYSEEDGAIARELEAFYVNTSSSRHAEGLPSVRIDNQIVGEMGADHLSEMDLDNFLFVGPTDLLHVQERYEGFIRALKRSQDSCTLLKYAPKEKGSLYSSEETVRPSELMNSLKDLPTPIGIMAATDRIGFAVLEACHRLGLRSPEDVSLIGVDNDEIYCNLAHTSMTSIDTHAREVGIRAADMLDKLMKGKPVENHQVRIPPRGVILRDSTDTTRSKYPEMARALRFIRNNAHRVIDVTNVIDVVPVSRRWLETKFKEELGHGIFHEIRRVHVDRAKELLADKTLTFSQVARESGFTTQERFYFAFEKVTGMKPSEYQSKAVAKPPRGLRK